MWLSTAYERPTVTISVHQDVNEPDEPYFCACEAIFDRFSGRPHWGKVHYLDGDRLAELYPKYRHWWATRDRDDPDGRFVSEYLATLRP